MEERLPGRFGERVGQDRAPYRERFRQPFTIVVMNLLVVLRG